MENVAKNTNISATKQWARILAYTNAADVKEADLYQCLILLPLLYHYYTNCLA